MKMRAIGAWLFLTSLFGIYSATAAVPDGEQLRKAVILSALLQDAPGAARLGARAIRIMYSKDEQMTDCIAERLLKITQTEPQKKWIWSAEGHIIMLGQLHNGRYRDVLKLVRSRTQNSEIQERVDDALREIGNENVGAYMPGSVSLIQKRAAVEEVLAAGKRSDRSGFATIKPETDFLDVMASIGAPDVVSEWPVKGQKFVLHYENLGVVLVTFAISTAASGKHEVELPRMLVQFVASERVPVSSIYKGKEYGYAQVLGSISGRSFVQYFKSQRRQIGLDMDAMYVMVRRILDSPPDGTRYDDVMYKASLSQLRLAPDPRGLEWLRQIANMPGTGFAKKFAHDMVVKEEKRIARGIPRPTEVDKDMDDDVNDDDDDDDDRKTH